MDVFDGISLGGPFVARLAGDVSRVIGAVVQHLNFKLFQRIIDLAGGGDDPLGNGCSLYIGNWTVTRGNSENWPLGW